VSRADEPLLSVRGLKKHFEAGDDSLGLFRRLLPGSVVEQRRVRAVDGVSFDLHAGETLGVVGESGCGKSTLSRSILALQTPTAGEVRLKGEPITDLSGETLRQKRQEMQIIFQDPTSALNPRMKIKHLIQEPLDNFYSLSRPELEARTDELLEEVALSTELRDRYPHELSGGQKQRVVIARAIALEPDLIVADEPVTGLDVSIQSDILNTLERIQEEQNIAMLFIAHDLSVVKHISDRVMVMYLGHVVESGATERVFADPQHPYTRALKRAIPRTHPDEPKGESEISGGEPPSPIDPPSGCPFHPRCPAYIGDVCEAEYPAPVELKGGREVACHHFEEGDPEIPDGEPLSGGVVVGGSGSGTGTSARPAEEGSQSHE